MNGPKISKLTSSNYSTWKDEVQVLLMERGSWGFIEGTEPELLSTASQRDKNDYKLRKSRAYSTIYLSISEEYRTLIAENKDGLTAWNKLKETFEPKSRCRIVQLLDAFFNVKYLPL